MPLNNDIDLQKNSLRKSFKSIRAALSKDEKKALDFNVFSHMINSVIFMNAETVITYVSTDIEVDTLEIIRYALNSKKKVAVPKCVDGTRLMDFYYIKSLDDLEVAAFSVLEPIKDKCIKVNSFDNSICLVPGLSFDMKGYRLGYGKGYYDRFLSKYNGSTIGLCYGSCLTDMLVINEYDKAVDYIVTEKNIYCTKGGNLCE